MRCQHCGKAYIGVAAHGWTKRYRHHVCFSRQRYGKVTCAADRIPADQAEGGILSTDRGKTWKSAARLAGVPGGGSGVVAITADAAALLWSPNNTDITPVYSTDLGATWNPVHGLPAGARIRSDRVNPSVLYAFAGGTFYRSTDAGATFSDTGAPGLPAEGVDDFRVVPGREGHVWLAGRSDKAEIATGLWRSADGGVTWERISAIDLAIGVGFGKAARGSRHEAKRGATRRSTPRPRSQGRTASSAQPTAAPLGCASTTTTTSGPGRDPLSPATRTSSAASICQHAA
ncbi:recombinase zinc beta ribbon domain-containing protein [Nonomuraea sp. NPDC049400]|uniref:recombinase zinc beta ribbon domain-containing protein n=1 Tax=Nonomuraea sp. NPDC049400 TaxID=3364352 RepID=UPI0037BA7434